MDEGNARHIGRVEEKIGRRKGWDRGSDEQDESLRGHKITFRMMPRSPSISPPVWVTRPV